MSKQFLPKLLLSLVILPAFFQVFYLQVPAAQAAVSVPVTAFNLVGEISYKNLGRLTAGMKRLVPAPNVLVTVVDFFDHSKRYTVTTDANGVYSLSLPAGLYQVTPSNTTNTFFTPPLKIERLNATSTRHVNFTGLMFP